MRRRHPIFGLGDASPGSGSSAGSGTERSGIVPTLPPLLKAVRLQERAASVGFDWPSVAGPLAKVREELAEVETELMPGAAASPTLQNEIGDLLFAVMISQGRRDDPMLALDPGEWESGDDSRGWSNSQGASGSRRERRTRGAGRAVEEIRHSSTDTAR